VRRRPVGRRRPTAAGGARGAGGVGRGPRRGSGRRGGVDSAGRPRLPSGRPEPGPGLASRAHSTSMAKRGLVADAAGLARSRSRGVGDRLVGAGPRGRASRPDGCADEDGLAASVDAERPRFRGPARRTGPYMTPIGSRRLPPAAPGSRRSSPRRPDQVGPRRCRARCAGPAGFSRQCSTVSAVVGRTSLSARRRTRRRLC